MSTHTQVPPRVGPVLPPTGRGTWSLSWHGVRAVAGLEWRQRLRSGNWRRMIALWMLVLLIITVLMNMATQINGATDPASRRSIYAAILALVLSLGGLITPALCATSINGDRRDGVLATMQASLLTPVEIVLGKLLTAWAVSLVFLVTSLPFLGWVALFGGASPQRVAVTVGLVAIMLFVVCALGLGWSAAAARTATSVAMTYLTIAAVCFGLPLSAMLGLNLTTEEVSRVSWQENYLPDPQNPNGPGMTTCEKSTYLTTITHSERIWWLMAPSPYVVVADAAPQPARLNNGSYNTDLFTEIRSGVRDLRLGTMDDSLATSSCDPGGQLPSWEEQERLRQNQRETAGATWPWGLSADLGLAAVALLIAVRRLRTPVARLSRGTRIS